MLQLIVRFIAALFARPVIRQRKVAEGPVSLPLGPLPSLECGLLSLTDDSLWLPEPAIAPRPLTQLRPAYALVTA